MDMALEMKILIGSVVFTIIQSMLGFVVLRFASSVDRLSKAVDQLGKSDARTSTMLGEHERRLDGHDEAFGTIKERCIDFHTRKGH